MEGRVNWKTYLPPRSQVGRFFKYAFLLIALSINLKIVFDGFSYYLARRSLDAELESKKVSSLEYLGVLQKRERAHVIDTLETRCTERSQLAIFRILDAQHLKALDEAYKTSLAMKDNLVYLLGQMEKDDKGLGQFVDLEALKAEANKAAFSLAIVDRALKPVDDVRRSDPQYQAAAKAVVDKLKETSKPYVDQLAAHAQMRAEAQKKLGKESPLFSDVDVLERRLERLRERRKETRQKLGTDLDEVLSRYAVWTEALSGGTDNPVLDEIAFQLRDDTRSRLINVDCSRFEAYFTKVTGQPLSKDEELAKREKASGFWLTLAVAPGAIVQFYRTNVNHFFNMPSVAQTLFVTLILGALGALTINVLRLSKVGWWAAQPDPAWGELILAPSLGALAAFGIFLLGSSGLLLTSDKSTGTSLSAFFIGMLGFISGLLYDEAFGRVRRFGAQLFAGDAAVVVTSPEDRSLAEALRAAKASFVADLVLKFGIGKRIADEPEFTLLVPSDDAMSRLTLQAWKEISEPTTRSKFESWFRRHHALKRVTSGDVRSKARDQIEVEDTSKYPLMVDGDVLVIGKAKAVQADIPWRNGVIHVLEQDVA
jgi:uncharacterized surface protein with fasciclin (FAS1) repeats